MSVLLNSKKNILLCYILSSVRLSLTSSPKFNTYIHVSAREECIVLVFVTRQRETIPYFARGSFRLRVPAGRRNVIERDWLRTYSVRTSCSRVIGHKCSLS